MSRMPRETAPRQRATAVVVDAEFLLVIRRQRDGRRYAVLPGGGVEPGETAAEGCLRELFEETGLHGTIRKNLTAADVEGQVYFHVEASGVPELGDPEHSRSSSVNVYEPVWVPIADLTSIGLVPASAVEAVRSALGDR